MKLTNNSIVLLFLIILFLFILFILWYLNKEDTISVKKDSFLQPPQEDMFNLYTTKDIGYPNCMGCFCYLNSALQFFRTVVYPFKNELDPIVQHFTQIVNKCHPTLNKVFLYYITQDDPELVKKLRELYTSVEQNGDGDANNQLIQIQSHPRFASSAHNYISDANFTQSDAHEFMVHLFNTCERYIQNIRKRQIQSSFLRYIRIKQTECIEYEHPVTNELIIQQENPSLYEYVYPVSIMENDIISLKKLVEDAFYPQESPIKRNRIIVYNNIEYPLEVNLVTYLEPSTYILLSFKIFTQDGKVIPFKINFQNYFTIYSNKPNNTAIRYKYKPISLICFLGKTIKGGHYINYSKRLMKPQQKITVGHWYAYDDSSSQELGGSVAEVQKDIEKRKAVPYMIALKRISTIESK